MDDFINAFAPMVLLAAYVFSLCIFPSALLLLLAWVVVILMVQFWRQSL